MFKIAAILNLKPVVGVGQTGIRLNRLTQMVARLSHAGLAETKAEKGVRQAGIRLNRLTQMVARLSHPYDGFQIETY